MDSSKEAGLAVKHRRQMLRLTISEASALGAVSTTTWTNVEAGKPVTQDTVIGVAQALGWRQDWLERLLSNEPVVLALDPTPQAPIQRRADEWEQQQGQTVKEWRESIEARFEDIERRLEALEAPAERHLRAANKGQAKGEAKNVTQTRRRNN